ncbi:MAG TPA: DUF6089 family protein [Flavisolibacter sp.]|jgi:hypothetical protein|nr:DUF6089 family protein [Flavisolibacter sp.]
MGTIIHSSILSFSLFFFLSSSAQTRTPLFEIGVNGGILVYQGDLTPSAVGSFKTPRFVLGFQGSKPLTKTVAVRIDFSRGSLHGDESLYSHPEWRQQRNFAFDAKTNEITASLVYQPVRNIKLQPYVFAGAGISFVRISRDYSRLNREFFSTETHLLEGLETDISHSLPRRIPILPVGLGIRYPLSSRLSVSGEAAYRFMNTDYLDGFSQSVNPDLKDHYYKFSLGMIYTFTAKAAWDCPANRF